MGTIHDLKENIKNNRAKEKSEKLKEKAINISKGSKAVVERQKQQKETQEIKNFVEKIEKLFDSYQEYLKNEIGKKQDLNALIPQPLKKPIGFFVQTINNIADTAFGSKLSLETQQNALDIFFSDLESRSQNWIGTCNDFVEEVKTDWDKIKNKILISTSDYSLPGTSAAKSPATFVGNIDKLLSSYNTESNQRYEF